MHIYAEFNFAIGKFLDFRGIFFSKKVIEGSVDFLKSIRKKNLKKVILGYININSKLDPSFPKSQFETIGHKSPYRLDVSDTSGGLLVYVKADLPSFLTS